MIQVLEKKLIATVRRAVAESMHDVLTDPDRGLELTPAVRARLLKYRAQKTSRLTSLADARRKFF